MNFGECNYHSWKTKMFQNSVTKGVKSLKAEWWQDKSWPTLGPTQFQTQTVKVPSIACFDLKKKTFSQGVLFFCISTTVLSANTMTLMMA